MSERVKQAIYYCEKYGQEHLANYMKPVFSDRSQQLADQILKTDLQQINQLFNEVVKKDEMDRLDSVNISDSLHNTKNENGESKGNIEDFNSKEVEEINDDIEDNIDPKTDTLTPPKIFNLEAATTDEKNELFHLGIEAIRGGEVAAVTMAGGQGTRLGHNGPKGTFVLDCTPPKSLFEIQCTRLKELSAKTGYTIPWLIMTSEENNKDTVSFFEANDYFGYDGNRVRFFTQSMMPAIDFNGKILVRDGNIAVGPDGNGGVFASLEKSGNLQWLRDLNIKRVYICGVDNALVKLADPLFIGLSIKSKADIACKSVLKRSYDEKAGVFCFKNNKPAYVEYTEISEAQAKATDANGNYIFGDIGIVMYVYTMDMLNKISKSALPYHEAKKKVPYSLPDGTSVDPKEPNGIKFETFIFDSFMQANDVEVLRVLRNEEFAPVKNREGEDSPATAAEMYNYIHRQ